LLAGGCRHGVECPRWPVGTRAHVPTLTGAGQRRRLEKALGPVGVLQRHLGSGWQPAQPGPDSRGVRCRTGRIGCSLRAGGATLDYHGYPGRGHFDLMGLRTSRTRWIDARLAESRCAAQVTLTGCTV
jgi:hypothetical protein